jgi:hypothetical protein
VEAPDGYILNGRLFVDAKAITWNFLNFPAALTNVRPPQHAMIGQRELVAFKPAHTQMKLDTQKFL